MRPILWTTVACLLLASGAFAEHNIQGEDILWQYAYEANKHPHASDPRFGRNSYPGKPVLSVKDGILNLTTEGDGKTNQGGYINMGTTAWQNTPASTIEMRLRIVEQIPGTLFAASLRARADKKALGIFFSADGVRLGGQATPADACAAVDATTFHVYRITLDANAVKLYLDGNPEPILTSPPESGLPRPLIEFGAFLSSAKFPENGLGGTSEWDYIRWTQTGAFPPGTTAKEARVRVETPEDRRTKAQAMVDKMAQITDPTERAAATVAAAKLLVEAGDTIPATQLLRGFARYQSDYAPAMEMLGYARFNDRWVPKESLPLWESGKVKHTLRVITFNMLRDLRNHPKWKWEKRQALVAAIINDYQPDLLGIQEIVDAMLDPLMPEIPGYTLVKMPCSPELRRGTYGGEFIYRTDRFELLGIEHYVFPPYDPVTGEVPEGGKGWGLRRGGSVIQLRDKLTGRTVCAFSSHVTHSNPPLNLLSCTLLKERLLKLPEDALVFMMGDFNISRTTPSCAVLTTGERPLSDPRALAMQRSISGNTNDGIDWLLFSPKEMPLLLYSVIRYTAGDIKASDHDAVFGEFGLD